MNAMESPLQCFTNQPNSSHTSSNTKADITFDGTADRTLQDTTSLTFSSYENELAIKQEREDTNSAIDRKFTIVNVLDCKLKLEPLSRHYSDSTNDISTINVNDLKEENDEDSHVFDESSYSASPSIPGEIPTDVVFKKEPVSFLGQLPKTKAKKRNKLSHTKTTGSKAAKYRHIGAAPKTGGSTTTRSRDPADKKHKCQFCDKSFACGYSLTRHVRIHTGEQCYKCDVCSKIFTTRSSKIRHDRTHSTEGTYKCEFCNKVFTRPIHLTDHQIEHTGAKPFSCGLCGKAFTKQFQLASHLKIHTKGKYTGKNPPAIETCELCGQGFPDHEHLLEHVKEHVAESKALQSDQIDSSNDPDNSVQTGASLPHTPVELQQPVTSFSAPEVVTQAQTNSDSTVASREIKSEVPQQLDPYYGGTIVTDKLLVDAHLSLQSNIAYVVGEDGTLQPQINYDLAAAAAHYDTQQSSPFDLSTINSAAAPDITHSEQEGTPLPVFEIVNSPGIPIKSEPVDDEQDNNTTQPSASIAASEIINVITNPIATVNELVSSESSSSATTTAAPIVVAPLSHSTSLPHLSTDSNLVIAQADTTSLDSLKTDDEDDDHLSTGLIDGQDILALACKDIFIAGGSGGSSGDNVTETTTTRSPGLKFISHQTSTSLSDNNASSASGGGNNMLNSDKEKKFHCEYCDKSFTQRNNLDSHTRTHTKEKPFKCTHCDMCFSQRWSLTRHVRIHTGEKPFKCAFCDASFRIKGEKTEHEKTNHMNERNERIAFQARLKGGTDGTARSLNDSITIGTGDSGGGGGVADRGDVMSGSVGGGNSNGTSSLPKIEFSAGMSNVAEPYVLSMSQTDDSDSKSDYESVQSSQYGEVDTKYSLDGSQDNMIMTQHQQHHHQLSTGSNNENEIKFHYGSEEQQQYVDAMGDNSPVLTTLNAAEFIMEEKGMTYHCDFCDASYVSRTELVQHFSTHTG